MPAATLGRCASTKLQALQRGSAASAAAAYFTSPSMLQQLMMIITLPADGEAQPGAAQPRVLRPLPAGAAARPAAQPRQRMPGSGKQGQAVAAAEWMDLCVAAHLQCWPCLLASSERLGSSSGQLAAHMSDVSSRFRQACCLQQQHSHPLVKRLGWLASRTPADL